MKRSLRQHTPTLRRLMRELSRHRSLLIGSLCFAILQAAAQLVIPVFTGRAVDTMLGQGQVDLSALAGCLTLLIVAAALASLFQYLLGLINNRLTVRTMQQLRTAAFRRLMRAPLAQIDRRSTGETVSRVMTDVDTLSDGLLIGFTQLTSGITTILGTLIMMLITDPGIALLVVLATPLSLFAAGFIARKTHALFARQSEARANQTAQTDEMLTGIKLISSFRAENWFLAQFDRQNDELRDASLKATFYSSLTNPVTRFVNAIIYGAVALFGALRVITGGMSVGTLSAFLSYASQYTRPFNEISGVMTEMTNALVCAGRIFELMDLPVESEEGAAALPTPRGLIHMQDVDFAYTPERPLIEHLDLNVDPGQRIAIVGPTGCGKTTLINLLMRFYDVDRGAITVDGRDIRSVTRESLRTAYGMVLQDTWLQSGTIRDNIRYGRPDATEEEIRAAARAAHAEPFILRMPQDYDTVIGEDGGSLSAGQKQLLCIARVMLTHPQMLILDEATSSIDTRTEVMIQSAFQTMMTGHTSFIVAHRLSTIRNADRILVMRDGHVIEQGSHDELIHAGGFYRELYMSQFETR